MAVVGTKARGSAGLLLLGLMALAGTQVLSGQSPPVFDAWISFSDKGIRSDAELRSALAGLEMTFDARALKRRRLRRTFPGLFDERDLPIDPGYLEAVSATGSQLRVRSHWLNGVSVLATRDQLAAAEKLLFVSEVSDVRPHPAGGSPIGRIPNDPDLKDAPPPPEAGPYGWAWTQIRQLGLDRLHGEGYRGEGVRIGVIDTGFLLRHPALQNSDRSINVVAEWDFVDNDGVVSPEEGDRHDLSGGTSMATPVLAGGVACLLQLHPEWTVDEIRSALFSSGSFFLEHGKPDPLYVWGYGIPDFSRFLDDIGVR